MFRRILTLVGITEILAPERLISSAESVVAENPEQCQLKPWVVPAARVEGICYLYMVWQSPQTYTVFKKFLGVVGILALVFPQQFIQYATESAYENGDAVIWKPWVYPLCRVVGVLYLLLALATAVRSGSID